MDELAGPAETDITISDSDESPTRDGQLRAPRRWERLLVEAAVISGRDRRRRRVDGLTNELHLRLAEIDGEDETRTAILARTLDDLSVFAGYALPLIDDLARLGVQSRIELGWDQVKVALPSASTEMRLGAVVVGRVETEGQEAAILPPGALLQSGKEPQVWVVGKDDKVGPARSSSPNSMVTRWW